MTTNDRPVGIRTDAVLSQVSRLLSTPGLPAQAVRNLGAADRAFGALDRALRGGHALPTCWAASDGTSSEDATDIYDVLSEALRTVGGVGPCFAAMREAVRAWQDLNAILRAGEGLPEPWWRDHDGVLPSPWERR